MPQGINIEGIYWAVTTKLLFGGLAFVLLMSALLVVSVRNLLHSALWLVLAFGTTAGFFILLNAEFLAWAQVLIYMGGIAILIIFAIMLSRKIVGWDIVMANRQSIPAALACFLLCMIFIWPPLGPPQLESFTTAQGLEVQRDTRVKGLIYTMDLTREPTLTITPDSIPERALATGLITPEQVAAAPGGKVSFTNYYRPNTAVLGQSLMSTYTIIFWVAAFLLTAAMIGALYIARKD